MSCTVLLVRLVADRWPQRWALLPAHLRLVVPFFRQTQGHASRRVVVRVHLCLRLGDVGAPIGLELGCQSPRGPWYRLLVVLCCEGCETENMVSLCSVVVEKRCFLPDLACCWRTSLIWVALSPCAVAQISIRLLRLKRSADHQQRSANESPICTILRKHVSTLRQVDCTLHNQRGELNTRARQ